MATHSPRVESFKRSPSAPRSTNHKSILDICTCPACMMMFREKEPKALIPRSMTTCGHTICTGCIEVWMVRGRGPGLQRDEVSCPMCRKLTRVPNGDVTELPINWTIIELLQVIPEPDQSEVAEMPIFCNMGCNENPVAYHCKQCQEYMCHSCGENSLCRTGECDNSHLLLTVHPPNPPKTWAFTTHQPLHPDEICPIHNGMPLNLVCPKRQNELICHVCRDMTEHRDHNHIPLATLAERKHESLQEVLYKLKWHLRHLCNGFDVCHHTNEELADEQRKMFSVIDALFERMENALRARCTALKELITDAVQHKSGVLKKQADNLSKNVANAKRICAVLERLSRSTEFEMVMSADEQLEEGRKLVESCQNFEPAFSPEFAFNDSGVDDIIVSIEKFGDIEYAPGPVQNIDVAMSVDNKVEAKLAWTAPITNWCTGTANHYIVQKRIASHDEEKDRNIPYKKVYSGPLKAITLPNVTKGVDHVFRVAAVSSAGTGPFVTTKPIRMDAPLFTWDTHKRHPAVRVSNDGYTASVGESARWISIGGSQILVSGRHYWELSLDRYGMTSPTKKIVAGIVSAKLDPTRWQRGRSVIGLYSSPFNVPSWSLAVQTGKKLSHNTSSRGISYHQRYLFQERDRLGILVDLDKQTLEYFRNGQSLGVAFEDVKGPVIPAVSFCHHKRVSLHFPPIPESHSMVNRPHIARQNSESIANRTPMRVKTLSLSEQPDVVCFLASEHNSEQHTTCSRST